MLILGVSSANRSDGSHSVLAVNLVSSDSVAVHSAVVPFEQLRDWCPPEPLHPESLYIPVLWSAAIRPVPRSVIQKSDLLKARVIVHACAGARPARSVVYGVGEIYDAKA